MGKVRLIALDCETYATRNQMLRNRITLEARAKRPNNNTKKELKDTWDTEGSIAQRISEALSKTAVNVLYAEVLCMCWQADLEPFHVESMTGERPAAESERDAVARLAMQWDAQADPETIWCGHNILEFDLQVILNRFRRHGVKPPEHFPRYINGRWSGRVFDTMKRTPCDNGLGMVSLDDVCEAYGLPAPKTVEFEGQPMCGSRVGPAYEAGKFETILEYCEADVVSVVELYSTMTCGDTWGTFDTAANVNEQLKVIEASQASEVEKARAARAVYIQAGWMDAA